jgi:hypothetical protein
MSMELPPPPLFDSIALNKVVVRMVPKSLRRRVSVSQLPQNKTWEICCGSSTCRKHYSLILGSLGTLVTFAVLCRIGFAIRFSRSARNWIIQSIRRQKPIHQPASQGITNAESVHASGEQRLLNSYLRQKVLELLLPETIAEKHCEWSHCNTFKLLFQIFLSHSPLGSSLGVPFQSDSRVSSKLFWVWISLWYLSCLTDRGQKFLYIWTISIMENEANAFQTLICNTT